MKARGSLLFAFIFFLSVSLFTGTAEEKLQEEKQGKGWTESLIRKDLLLREWKKLEPPKRNIFTPQRSRFDENPLREFPSEQNIREGQLKDESLNEDEGQIVFFNLRYIGYVDSGRKIVALIIFEGVAQAVEEGDVISEGVRIGKILKAEIEVIGPDSKQRKFSLEGEKP